MKSMTGYGVSRYKSNDLYIEIIVQSYNSKHFESRAHIPPFYSSLEVEMRKSLQHKIDRGFVNLIVTRNPLWPAKKTEIKWNIQQALKWKKLYAQMAKALKVNNDVGVFNLAQQTGVLELSSKTAVISSLEKNRLFRLLSQALQLCNKERKREGDFLKKDFQKNLKKLEFSLKKIKIYFIKQNTVASQNWEEKVRDLSIVSNQKTKQEVISSVILRMDVTEEIQRMNEHIKTFRECLNSIEPVGKKMGFYLQEMIREVNTIGSKSQDIKLIQEVVQAKSIIEKMREQTQNVE